MNKKLSGPFAEILDSNIISFTAQCWEWNTPIEFGALITTTTNNRKIFGIVYDIATTPFDANRQPVTYQMTQEQLLQHQPQIFEFLSTKFSCVAIGYSEEHNNMIYNVPPQPTKMHEFVIYGTKQDYIECFEHAQFLYLLHNANLPCNLQELLLAIIKQQINNQVLTKKRLNGLIESFFMLNKNNYLQTKMFLSRLQQLLKNINLH